MTRLLLLAAALLVTVPTLSAQTVSDAFRYSQRDVGSGARAIGLAGVGAAGIDDISALVSNPAGLGFYKASEVMGSLALGSTTVNANYLVGDAGFSRDETAGTVRIGNAAFVSRAPTVRGSLVFAAAYNQTASFDRTLAFRGETNQSSISASFLPFDDEISIDADGNLSIISDPVFTAFRGGLIEYLPENIGTDQALFYEAVAPGTLIEQRSEVQERGAMHEISFGGAIEAAPGIMIGAGANLTVGRYELERRFEERDINDANGPDDYIVLLDDGSELRGFDRSTFDVGLTSDMLGINGRFGVAIQPQGSPLRVGLSAETPTYLSINEDFFTRVSTEFDQGGSLEFTDRDEDTIPNDFEYALVTPWRVSGGVAYSAGPLYASIDVEWMDWGTMYFDDINGGASATFRALNDEISDRYDQVYNVRLGGEFTHQQFSVRAGLAFEQDPIANNSDVFDDGDETDLDRARTTASFGTSFDLGNRATLDLGYSYTQFDDSNIPYFDPAASPFVNEDVQRSRFLIGIRVGI